jgi:hypothetical protein
MAAASALPASSVLADSPSGKPRALRLADSV